MVSRDVLYYRKLTDLPIEEKDKEKAPAPAAAFLEALARGRFLFLADFIASKVVAPAVTIAL